VATQVTSQDRLLLLDGHSLAYRAFFALPIENFSTTTGQPTNAVYGFTAMLINVLRDEKPTHVAVAFDRGEPTFRHEQYVEYKANRRETPEDFRSQLSLIFEVLDALGIRRLSAPGYEADDLIATLATQAAAQDMDVLIVTGDRDVLQLVSDQVTVLMTRRGITEMTRFTPETVAEKYGLSPAQYPDFAAVRGDPSDNLPGIPGVGEKTATKWIAEFGSLQALVDRVGEVKGKEGETVTFTLWFTFAERGGFVKRFTPVCTNQGIPVNASVILNFHWKEYDNGTTPSTPGCYLIDGYTVVK